jgi:hypothetical protein
MYIGSSFNIKNKIAQNPILINNVPVPRTENYTCLGVDLDERFTWETYFLWDFSVFHRYTRYVFH